MVRSAEKSWLRAINLGFFYVLTPSIDWNANTGQLLINSNRQKIRCISVFLNILLGLLSLFALTHYKWFKNEAFVSLNFGQISILALTVCVTFGSTSVIGLHLWYPSTFSGINQLIALRAKVYKCKLLII